MRNLRLPVFDPSDPTEVKKTDGAGPIKKSDQAAAAKAAPPFILGEGLPPIPAKLVAKIQRGEFVDMAELLRDNIEADRRRTKEGDADPSGGQPSSSQTRREIPDLLSWIQCFGVYACIVAKSHPDKLQQLLAYQTMLVREARRCGGNGWQAYDTMFRQQVANDPAADWSKLNSSLYSVTFLAYQNGRGKTCLHCLETDHTGSDCALASTKGYCTARSPINDDMRNTRGKVDRGERSTRICYSWNDGRCAVPYCRYRHICAKCQGEHKASQCTTYPHRSDAKGVKKE